MNSEPLLTPEELCEHGSIDRSAYDDETLRGFIEKFHLTATSVRKINPALLLRRWVESPFENVTYLLDRKRPVCMDGRVEEIHRIALEENDFFHNESVFYDLTAGRRCRGTNMNLFVNLLNGKETRLSSEEIQRLREELDRLDLLHWTVAPQERPMHTDYRVTRIAVEFRDGSVFRLGAVDDADKAFSGDYSALRKLLME